MSKADKRAPLPVDPGLAAAEAQRQADLAGSGAYQRGRAQAKAIQVANDRQTLAAELVTLKKWTPDRDKNPQSRDAYNRVYNRVVAAAKRLALGTGQPVSGIPAWLAPPAPTEESTVTIGVPGPDPSALLTPQGKVAKPAGMGKSGRGGTAPGYPGSDADTAWLNVQGTA